MNSALRPQPAGDEFTQPLPTFLAYINSIKQYAREQAFIGEDVEESAIAKPIVAVYEEKRGVGVFALYKAASKVRVCSFDDNDDFDALESALVQLSPMECFVLEGAKVANPAFAKVVQAGNYLINSVPSKISDAREALWVKFLDVNSNLGRLSSNQIRAKMLKGNQIHQT